MPEDDPLGPYEAELADIVKVANDGRPAIVQYLQSDGTTITAGLTDLHTIQIVVKHNAEHKWVRALDDDG